MNFSYENQGTHTYLVYTISEEDNIDSMSLGMLTNNKIPGLAQAMYTQMDSQRYIKYDVSARVSVKQFFLGPVNKKRLVGVFKGIVDAMLSVEDYMIDVNSVLLDLDYVFADVSSCETVLICLPVVIDDAQSKDLGDFFRKIMFTTQFDQTENCDHVARIINYLNSSLVFSLTDFKKVLDEISGNVASTVLAGGVVNSAPASQQQVYAQQTYTAVTQQQAKSQSVVSQQNNQQNQMQQNHKQPMQSPQVNIPVSAQSAEQQKQMTMFGLLRHYSKENAAIYKQQQAAKKAVQSQATNNKSVQTGKKQSAKSQQQVGFAVPGQSIPANQSFAVPGQQTSVQQAQAKQTVQQNVKLQQTMMQQTVAQQTVAQQTVAQQPTIQSKPASFGETTVLGNGNIGETTVLGVTSEAQVRPHLVREKNNEIVNIVKPSFRIGKEKSYVDYFIGDNSAISRGHANIIKQDGEYYIMDTNSTNHTYVNGQMIQSNVAVKIVHGTKIRLANENFEFRLY